MSLNFNRNWGVLRYVLKICPTLMTESQSNFIMEGGNKFEIVIWFGWYTLPGFATETNLDWRRTPLAQWTLDKFIVNLNIICCERYETFGTNFSYCSIYGFFSFDFALVITSAGRGRIVRLKIDCQLVQSLHVMIVMTLSPSRPLPPHHPSLLGTFC